MNLQCLNSIGEGDQETVDHGLGSWRSRTHVGPEAVKRGQLDQEANILDGSGVGSLMCCKKTLLLVNIYKRQSLHNREEIAIRRVPIL